MLQVYALSPPGQHRDERCAAVSLGLRSHGGATGVGFLGRGEGQAESTGAQGKDNAATNTEAASLRGRLPRPAQPVLSFLKMVQNSTVTATISEHTHHQP